MKHRPAAIACCLVIGAVPLSVHWHNRQFTAPIRKRHHPWPDSALIVNLKSLDFSAIPATCTMLVSNYGNKPLRVDTFGLRGVVFQTVFEDLNEREWRLRMKEVPIGNVVVTPSPKSEFETLILPNETIEFLVQLPQTVVGIQRCGWNIVKSEPAVRLRYDVQCDQYVATADKSKVYQQGAQGSGLLEIVHPN